METPPQPPIPGAAASSRIPRLARAAALVLAPLAAAVCIWVFDPGQPGFPVPAICLFRFLTGLDCPGCGGTRAMHQLVHGRILNALDHNALTVILAPLVGIWMLRRAADDLMGRPWPAPRRPLALALGLAGAVLAFGLLRNIPVWPFTILDSERTARE